MAASRDWVRCKDPELGVGGSFLFQKIVLI